VCLLRRGVVSTSPNPQTGGPPLIGCLRLLMQFIHSYPPYRRPFLHPQPEDAPCRGDRDPHKYIYLFIYLFSKSTQNNGGHLNSQLFHLIRVIGITACDRLDGLGFETWRGTRSCTPVQTSHKILHTCTDQPQDLAHLYRPATRSSTPVQTSHKIFHTCTDQPQDLPHLYRPATRLPNHPV